MNNQNSEIHVAIAFDEGYVSPVYVFLTSLFVSNSDNTIIVHAIATGIGEEVKEGLKDFSSKYKGKIEFYNIGPEVTANFPLPDNPGAYITLATYYRLFFPQLIDQSISRLIYIDADTLVIGNLEQFYNYSLGGKVILAVAEAEMEPRPDIEFNNLSDYFNAGVLLMDLVQWRAQHITERALSVIASYGNRLKYHDQDALNLVFRGNWQRADIRFNLMKAYIPQDLPRRSYQDFLSDKVIIHYNGSLKPWHQACENKFRYLYDKYFMQSLLPSDKRYIKKRLTVRGTRRFVFTRILEMYFNYPEVGQMWRRFKSFAGK
jgi:lipopolysaccharide biosynthesis glycosyltransferase